MTAATKAAVLQTSPQFAKKFASTVEKVNKSERKTVVRDLSHKEVVKEIEKKSHKEVVREKEKKAKKTAIPQENKKKLVSNKRKLSPEKVSNKRKKTKLNTKKEEEEEEEKDDSNSIRRSRRETTRISTLATLNSSNAADVETKSRESSVESAQSESIQEEKKSPVKVSTTISQKKDSQVNKKSKFPKNAERKPSTVKQSSTNGEAAKISKERKKTQKPLPAAPSPSSGGARRSARSTTAISTLASNNAASQATFVVEESTSEEEDQEDLDREEEDTVEKVETTPKKRGRGRPKADATPLSPNNPFAAITREYKEQQKIAAKLKRKRKSSLSPDDRPRLLTEAENNKLFDSLFDGDSPSPPPPTKVVKQKSRSSNSSKKQLHTDTTHKTSIASSKSEVLEANKKPDPLETKPASIKKPEIKAQTSTKKESAPPPPSNAPPASLKWLQSPSLSPLKSAPAPRVIAPWRQICDQKGRDKKTQEKEDNSDDVYEFSGPVEQGDKKVWGRAKPDLDSPERKMFMISKHGAYSGQLAGLKRKLEQKREELEAGGAESPEQETRNGSPPHKAVSGSPMIDPSQRVGHSAPRPQGKARLGSQRLGGAIKGSLTTPGSHQLSLTSLASDYNIVAAVSKYHNNIVPASSPDIPRHLGLNSEPEPDQNLPEKGRRKSLLLSKIFSKPKDQDSEDSDNADNGVSAEEEEKSVKDMKKVKQKKQTGGSLRRPLRNSSSRNVSLREASSESEGSGGAEERLGERTNTSIVCTSCHKYIA